MSYAQDTPVERRASGEGQESHDRDAILLLEHLDHGLAADSHTSPQVQARLRHALRWCEQEIARFYEVENGTSQDYFRQAAAMVRNATGCDNAEPVAIMLLQQRPRTIVRVQSHVWGNSINAYFSVQSLPASPVRLPYEGPVEDIIQFSETSLQFWDPHFYMPFDEHSQFAKEPPAFRSSEIITPRACPLLHLPQEIRDIVYLHAYASGVSCTIVRALEVTRRTVISQHALLAVNHRVRNEVFQLMNSAAGCIAEEVLLLLSPTYDCLKTAARFGRTLLQDGQKLHLALYFNSPLHHIDALTRALRLLKPLHGSIEKYFLFFTPTGQESLHLFLWCTIWDAFREAGIQDLEPSATDIYLFAGQTFGQQQFAYVNWGRNRSSGGTTIPYCIPTQTFFDRRTFGLYAETMSLMILSEEYGEDLARDAPSNNSMKGFIATGRKLVKDMLWTKVPFHDVSDNERKILEQVFSHFPSGPEDSTLCEDLHGIIEDARSDEKDRIADSI